MGRTSIMALTTLIAGAGIGRAQVGGNVAYSQAGGKARAVQEERNRRVLSAQELPPSATSTFVEADVLMNVKADEFVAVFGITHEGDSPAECNRKMEDTIRAFAAALKPLGIGGDDLFVDFVAQNRIYGFEVQGDIAREKPVGFELKKNASIRYRDRSMIDRVVLAAAGAQVFDLIKVDYIVKDIRRVQDRLMEEAARIIKRKSARYEKLLDIKLRPPGQVYAERTAAHYPTGRYDSYTAFESEQMGAPPDRQRFTIQTARKTRTFFFNGLDADGYDAVIDPVVIEPVVQFTLYLKVKYEVEQIKAR